MFNNIRNGIVYVKLPGDPSVLLKVTALRSVNVEMGK
jgi:hypothetical protein